MDSFLMENNFLHLYDLFLDLFTYKENDLFKLLNNSLHGKIILGKYKSCKEIEYNKLTDIIISNALGKSDLGSQKYKIFSNDLKDFIEQICELFPTENSEYFYTPYCRSSENQAISAKGILYNHYKYLRKQLKLAGLLSLSKQDDTLHANDSVEDEPLNLNCLTDQNREVYSASDVMRVWEQTFSEREKVLISCKKAKDPIKKYLDSFACLKDPLAITLLESDFGRRCVELSKNQNADVDDISAQSSSLFSNSWPQLAKKIIVHCGKSRIKEVKDFTKLHKELIEAGTHNSTLGLFLLPLCVTVRKTLKDGTNPDETVTISKPDISKSFILHVQEFIDLDREKEEFENWLKRSGQPILPYVIFCGKIDRILISYVVFNGKKFPYEKPLIAVESCFKCLTSLRQWPYLCDFAWGFIQIAIFNFKSQKTWSAVLKLIVDLNKQQ